MSDETVMKFSHVKLGDTEFKGVGLRDFLSIGISALPTQPVAK